MSNNFGKLIIGSMPVGTESLSAEMQKALIESDYILCENISTFLYTIYNDNNIKTNAEIMVYSRKDLTSGLIITVGEDRYLSVDKAIEYIKKGKTILLTTECGYPSIADPGSSYISACNFNGIDVEIISGGSIPSMAFVASGLQNDKKGFIYQSLFNFNLKEKAKVVIDIIKTGYPIVLLDYTELYYDTLKCIKDEFNDIYTVAVCVDLATNKSKIYMYTIDESLEYFKGSKRLPFQSELIQQCPAGMHTIVIREKE